MSHQAFPTALHLSMLYLCFYSNTQISLIIKEKEVIGIQDGIEGAGGRGWEMMS